MEFYFCDREFTVQGIASTDGAGTIKMDDDLESIDESESVYTFSGVLYFTDKQRDQIKRMSALGNYIIYQRANGSQACMTIMETNYNPTEGTCELICEDGALDLLNNVVSQWTETSAQSFEYYFNKTLADTGFTLNENCFKGLTRTISFDQENTALERLRSIISEFGGGRFRINFEFRNTELVSKSIDIVEELGEEKPITLRVGREVNSITTSGNLYELTTAVRAFGNQKEGSNVRVSLSGYAWTDPDKRLELRNGVLVDTQEAPKWSRLLSTTTGLFTRTKIYDTDDQGTLLSLARQELLKNSQPAVNYEVDLASVPENIEIGDRVDVVDENDELFLSAKVLKMERCTARDETRITLGDFLIQYSGLDPQLVQIANDFSKQFDESIPAEVIITPSKQFFVDGQGSITLTATVKKGKDDITNLFTSFIWSRYNDKNELDTTFSATGKSITITAGDSTVYTYYCTADY